MNKMSLDKAGEDFIKAFETLRLAPYLDQKGLPTQGWGHTDGVSMDSKPVSEFQAEKWFNSDVDFAEAAVNRYVSVPIRQNQFNALVDFTFNLGSGRLLTSTLLSKLNRGDIQGASKEFDRWVYYEDPRTKEMAKSPGLINRRAAEQVLFLKV